MHIETLEKRRLLSVALELADGTLSVRADEADNRVVFEHKALLNFRSEPTSEQLIVHMDGQQFTYPSRDVLVVYVWAFGGDDLVIAGRAAPQRFVINGGDGDDTIGGGRADDTLLGSAGNDVLDGNQGSDALDGGAGDDRLHSGRLSPEPTTEVNSDVVFGGEGQDFVGVHGRNYFGGEVETFYFNRNGPAIAEGIEIAQGVLYRQQFPDQFTRGVVEWTLETDGSVANVTFEKVKNEGETRFTDEWLTVGVRITVTHADELMPARVFNKAFPLEKGHDPRSVLKDTDPSPRRSLHTMTTVYALFGPERVLVRDPWRVEEHPLLPATVGD